MMNCSLLMGRLTRTPELTPTENGLSVLRFSLAVDRDYVSKDTQERGVDFIDCVAFAGPADFIVKYFGKGDMVAVCGRIQVRNWKDTDGAKRKSTEVKVERAWFCGAKRASRPEDNAPADGLPSMEELNAIFPPEDVDELLP